MTLMLSGAAFGQDWIETQRLTADEPAMEDVFGSAIDFDGESIIVGVPNLDSDLENEGGAYVFVRDGEGWRRQAVLRSASPEIDGIFGSSVAIQGDLAVVGSILGDGIEVDSGTATVFRRSGDEWIAITTLSASDGETGAQFGHSATIDHGTIAIGAVTDSDTGSVYVFEPDAGAWVESAKLQPISFPMTGSFGSSVAVSGEVLAVGATRSGTDDDRPGAVYVYERSDGNWIETVRLVGTGLQSGARFGWDVDIDADRIIAGGISAGRQQGKAFIFLNDGEMWQEETELIAPNTEGSTFGTVSIDGGIAVVGAQNFDLGARATGRAFIYQLRNGSWVLSDLINSSNPTEFALFGNSVAVDGQTIVAAAALESDDAFRAGAAYVFEPNPCLPDIDGDGSLTIFDFLAFQTAFDAGDPVADFDRDGDFTIFDFLAFQTAFDAGCP
ncbi:MAG: GC-type dockerin domain-anchored protein [Phycisphaerales bacterium]